MQRLVQENDSLLLELHNTQEQLEHALHINEVLELQLVEVEAKLKRMREAYPKYIDIGKATARVCTISDTGFIFDWLIESVVIDSFEVDNIYVRFDTSPGNERLIFPRFLSDSASNSWIEWDSIPHVLESLTICSDQPILECRQGKNGKFLNATEWRTLIKILEILESLLKDRAEMLQLSETMIVSQTAAVETLTRASKRWPIMLRHDKCDLIGMDVRIGYQGLQFRITNASISSRAVPELVFTLATVDEVPSLFGTYPRLEIAKSSNTFLEGWFPESIDERGERWELRFAAPTEMDMNIWSRLSNNDQILMAGIIAELPAIVELAHSKNNHFNKHREEWQYLARSVRNIARTHLT